MAAGAHAEPGAEVRADRLGLRTRRGWVFRDVDADIAPGELVAVTGASGSGRTSLLLAVAGRFAISHGSLSVGGHPLPRTAAAVRRISALGLVAGAHEPEPALTVAEHLTERLALLGTGPWWPRRRRALARTVLAESGFDLDPDALGRDLDPYRRQLLGLVLADLTAPRLLVVDDVDGGTDSAERAALWYALRQRAAAGVTVLASCREVGDAQVDRTVRLGHRDAPHTDEDPARTGTPTDTAGEATRNSGAGGGGEDTVASDRGGGEPARQGVA